jgi:hypothetical protein
VHDSNYPGSGLGIRGSNSELVLAVVQVVDVSTC